MDPILDQVVKKLAGYRASAPADFAALKPEELDQIVREQTQGKYGLSDLTKLDVGNLGRSFGNGMLMNWANQFYGMFGANKDENALREDLFHKARPGADVLAQMAGSIPTALLAPEAKGASLAGQVGRSAALGAGMGATAGSGAAANSNGDITRGAVTGGAVGGTLGAVIPAAAGLYNYMRDPAAAALARLSNAIQRSGGVDAMRGAAQSFVDNGVGKEAMLADLSPYLRNQADFAATNSQDTFVPMATKLASRQADQSDRLLQGTKQLIGDVPSVKQGMDALQTSRDAFADNAYGAMRDAGSTFDTAPLASALKKPPIMQAWKQARMAGDLTANDPIDQFMQRLLGANPGVDEKTIRKIAESNAIQLPVNPIREVSFGDLQSFKQLLDDRVTGAFAKGQGNLAKSYKQIRNAVVDVMEEGSPGYKATNAEYGRRIGLENALEAGSEAWKNVDSRDLADQVAKYSPEELQHFRQGMAAEMTSKLRNAATNRDEATKLVNASPTMKDKLKVVFGDEATFDKFMARAHAEAELHKLSSAVGGAATARRLSEAGISPEELGVDAAAQLAHGGIFSAILKGATKASKGALVRRTAGEMGPMLMTQGQPAIDQLLKTIQTSEPLVGLFGSRAAPAAAGRGLLDYLNR